MKKEKKYRILCPMIVNRITGEIVKIFLDQNDCRHKKSGVNNVRFRTELQVKAQKSTEKK